MDILSALLSGPRGPTRLAQACNINYGRLEGFTTALLQKGLIRQESQEEQQVFALTEEGRAIYLEWVELWRKLPLG